MVSIIKQTVSPATCTIGGVVVVLVVVLVDYKVAIVGWRRSRRNPLRAAE